MLSEKYRPKSLSEIISQPTYELLQWAKTWNSNTSIKSALLYGPPGTGKTSCAKALANDLEWEYLEINSSDVRTPQAIKKEIGSAIVNTPWETRVLILIDEIDGILAVKGEKKKSLTELEILIDASKNPIVITCNDEYALKKVTPYFRKECLCIKFGPLKDSAVQMVVNQIADKENIEIKDVPNLVKASHGDVRFAINNIETSTEVEPRHEDKDIFHIVHDIFAGYWDGDLGNQDLDFIWYTVKANIYNFYDDIYGETVPEFMDKVNRLFEHIYQGISTEGKDAFRYWPYIISLLKNMPRHQKTARIEIPRITIPEIRKQFYKTKDPKIQKLANYLHMSYAKTNNSEMKQFLQFMPDYTPDARMDYKSPTPRLELATAAIEKTETNEEDTVAISVPTVSVVVSEASNSLFESVDKIPEKKWKTLI